MELLQPKRFVVPCTAGFGHSGSVNFLDEDGLVDLQDAADFIDAYNNGC